MIKTTSTTKKAIIAAVIGHSFWGLSFMASRTALDTTPVLLLLSHRFLLAFLIMSALLLTPIGSIRLRGKPLLPLIFLGLLEPVIYFFGEQYGILHSSTVFSGVMIALIPIVSVLIAIPVLREKLTLKQFCYSLLSVSGVIGIGFMTNSSGSLDWIGLAGLLVAVFSAVAYTLLNRGISEKYTPFERTYFMIGFGAAVFTILAVFSVQGNPGLYFRPFQEPSYVTAVLFLSVCCSVISYFLTSYALTVLSVARATVFANLTTAVSVFAGVVFLHEPFSIIGLLCSIMVLAGIFGVQHSARIETGKMPTLSFSVRKSTPEDIRRIMRIYERARSFMAKTGNPRQWGLSGYPSEDLIRQDIADGNSYVCEYNGAVAGTFFFQYGEKIEPTYENIEEGKWKDDSAYGVIHRLASDGSAKGTGRYCILWALERCGHIRIDTHADNRIMRTLLSGLGFAECGIVHVREDRDPRIAFEKTTRDTESGK